jgi:fatty acid desaturase
MTGGSVHAAPVPGGANLGGALVVAGVALALLLAVPGLGEAHVAWAAAVAFVLATVPHWALIHEAVHGHFHRSPAVNDAAGRLLAILFLSPFDGLRFGHLSHHALNARAVERPEFYDPGRSSRVRAAAIYYVRLLGGLYLLEVASGPLSLLPRGALRPLVRRVFYDGAPEAGNMADRAERVLLAPAALRRLRLDTLAVLVLLGAAAWVHGAAWPVLVAAVAGRAVVVSLMDNAPHYGGELADPGQGYDLRLPRPLAPLVLNTNLHGTHHRHPNLPWTALPLAFQERAGNYSGSYLLTPWRQLRGPMPLPPERGRSAA